MAPNYKKCTILELKRFIKDRKGELPPESRFKKSYITELRRLDREMTFPRFQDLAPELRNLVYRVLMPPIAGVPRYHGIIAASKQMRIEAEGILYEETQMKVTIDEMLGNTEVRLGKTKIPHPPVTHCSLVDLYNAFPSKQLLRTGRLRINVNIRVYYGLRNYRFDNDLLSVRVNPVLYALVSLLEGNERLSEVQIHFVQHGVGFSLGNDDIYKILWPITKLSSEARPLMITFVDVPDRVQQRLQLPPPWSPFDAPRALLTLSHIVNAQRELYELAEHLGKLDPKIELLRFSCIGIEAYTRETKLVDESIDEQIQKAAWTFQRTFDEFKLEDMRTSLQMEKDLKEGCRELWGWHKEMDEAYIQIQASRRYKAVR